jgi:SAM-dependent methyltransferase
MTDLPLHAQRNRAYWNRIAPSYVEQGRRNWEQAEATWGIWDVPESQLHFLPENVQGLDVIELGCGTAYVSAWLARRGARPVGIDNSQSQLQTAQTFQHEFGLTFPLIFGSAEAVPLPDASFDLAVSEYGASIWCDPYRWIPEAARLLRVGGRLVFLVNSVLLMLCVPEQDDMPAGERLLRPQFGLHWMEWPGDESVEFHLGHGDMVRLLRRSGFDVEDLIEIGAPEGSTTRYPFVTRDWAARWPTEEIWKARKVR